MRLKYNDMIYSVISARKTASLLIIEVHSANGNVANTMSFSMRDVGEAELYFNRLLQEGFADFTGCQKF